VIKIDNANYQIYRNVYEVFWKHYYVLIKASAASQGVDVSNLPSPIEVLKDVEKKSKAHALKSLKSGFTDMLQNLANAPDGFTTALDFDLKAKGLPGYFQLYAEIKDITLLVLKRGSIRSMKEYYFIMEILNDNTSAIKAEERAILNTCVINFELKPAGKH
jgi:hypothetical protein